MVVLDLGFGCVSELLDCWTGLPASTVVESGFEGHHVVLCNREAVVLSFVAGCEFAKGRWQGGRHVFDSAASDGLDLNLNLRGDLLVSVDSEATLVGSAEAYDCVCSGSFDRTSFPV